MKRYYYYSFARSTQVGCGIQETEGEFNLFQIVSAESKQDDPAIVTFWKEISSDQAKLLLNIK